MSDPWAHLGWRPAAAQAAAPSRPAPPQCRAHVRVAGRARVLACMCKGTSPAARTDRRTQLCRPKRCTLACWARHVVGAAPADRLGGRNVRRGWRRSVPPLTTTPPLECHVRPARHASCFDGVCRQQEGSRGGSCRAVVLRWSDLHARSCMRVFTACMRVFTACMRVYTSCATWSPSPGRDTWALPTRPEGRAGDALRVILRVMCVWFEAWREGVGGQKTSGDGQWTCRVCYASDGVCSMHTPGCR